MRIRFLSSIYLQLGLITCSPLSWNHCIKTKTLNLWDVFFQNGQSETCIYVQYELWVRLRAGHLFCGIRRVKWRQLIDPLWVKLVSRLREAHYFSLLHSAGYQRAHWDLFSSFFLFLFIQSLKKLISFQGCLLLGAQPFFVTCTNTVFFWHFENQYDELSWKKEWRGPVPNEGVGNFAQRFLSFSHYTHPPTSAKGGGALWQLVLEW